MMDSPTKRSFSEAFSSPMSSQALEVFVGILLALWTFGQVVFANSAVATVEWVTALNPLQFIQAIVAGCLIAAVACKGLDITLSGAVGLFCLLLPALVVWNRTGDCHLIILALFLIAAKDMDFVRLLKFYAASAIAGFIVAIASFLFLYSTDESFSIIDALLGRNAFEYPSSFAYLLFSILAAIAISAKRGSVGRIALLLACAICAAIAFVPLHAKRCAIFMVVLMACVFFDEYKPNAVVSKLNRRETRWLVAALPPALFCMSNDMMNFFGLGADASAFAGIVPTYGYAAVACLAVLYVRSVLLWKDDSRKLVVWSTFILFALCCMTGKQPMYLEFNCALILLSGGLGSGPILRSKENASEE